MRRSSLLAAPLVALAVAAPAGAQWSPPATATDPLPDVGTPALSFGRTDVGVVWAPGRNALGGRPEGVLGVLPSGPRFRAASIDGAPARYATRRVVFPHAVARGALTSDVGVSFGDTSGRIGARRVLASRVTLAQGPVLAVAPSGACVLAWVERRRDGGTRLRVSLRRPGGAFGRPRTIRGTGAQLGVRVAVGERGGFAVVYQQDAGRAGRSVEVRRGSVGRGPGRVERVGPSGGEDQIDLAVARSGRVTVAWVTHDRGEETNTAPRVFAAVRPAGADGFRDAQRLYVSEAVASPLGRLGVAAGPDGTATVAFAGARGAGVTPASRVLVATQDARGRFGAPADLALDAFPLGVDVSRRGETTVAFARRSGGGIFARVRPAGGAFGPPELVAAEAPARLGDVAYTGASQASVVAWSTGSEVRTSRRG